MVSDSKYYSLGFIRYAGMFVLGIGLKANFVALSLGLGNVWPWPLPCSYALGIGINYKAKIMEIVRDISGKSTVSWLRLKLIIT